MSNIGDLYQPINEWQRVPSFLLSGARWVSWRQEEHNGRPREVPYQPNYQTAQENDPTT